MMRARRRKANARKTRHMLSRWGVPFRFFKYMDGAVDLLVAQMERDLMGFR